MVSQEGRKYPKTCTHCGTEYMGLKPTSIFCSNACKFESRKRPLLEEDELKLLEFYESGLTWQEVQKAMGIGYCTRKKLVAQLKAKTDFQSRAGKKLNQEGENNDSWKGGRSKASGYVLVKDPTHPRGRGGSRGYVMEHVLVMEAYIGRYIIFNGRQHPDNEIVHHVNGIRDDNRLENLVLMLSREHSFLHGNQKWAREIVDTTNQITYPSFKEACLASQLNENELATYIHFRWKRHGIIWQYSGMDAITGRVLES